MLKCFKETLSLVQSLWALSLNPIQVSWASHWCFAVWGRKSGVGTGGCAGMEKEQASFKTYLNDLWILEPAMDALWRSYIDVGLGEEDFFLGLVTIEAWREALLSWRQAWRKKSLVDTLLACSLTSGRLLINGDFSRISHIVMWALS